MLAERVSLPYWVLRRVLCLIGRFPIESRGRRKKLREVGFVTGICATCFTLRALIVAWAAFDQVSTSRDTRLTDM